MAKTKRPSGSAWAVIMFPWVRLVRVTVAPDSAPPWESCTAPDMDALVVWARSAGGPARNRAAATTANTAATRLLTSAIVLSSSLSKLGFGTWAQQYGQDRGLS